MNYEDLLINLLSKPKKSTTKTELIGVWIGVDAANIGDEQKITVVGKVDPAKLRERVEHKTHKKVELISPQLKKDDNKNGDNKEKAKGKENSGSNNAKQEKKKESKDKNSKNNSDEKKSKEKEVTVFLSNQTPFFLFI